MDTLILSLKEDDNSYSNNDLEILKPYLNKPIDLKILVNLASKIDVCIVGSNETTLFIDHPYGYV
jgi:hypothetical protein